MIHPYLYKDTLESKRLVTRYLQMADATLWVPYFDDKHGSRFMSDFGLIESIDKAEFMIKRQIDRYANNQFGLQALLLKDSGNFVGMCGLLEQVVEGFIEVEIGYHLLPNYRKLGLATEAAQLFKNFAFQHLEVNSVISLIHPQNFESQAVAKRNGMYHIKNAMHNGVEAMVFQIPKSAWSIK